MAPQADSVSITDSKKFLIIAKFEFNLVILGVVKISDDRFVQINDSNNLDKVT